MSSQSLLNMMTVRRLVQAHTPTDELSPTVLRSYCPVEGHKSLGITCNVLVDDQDSTLRQKTRTPVFALKIRQQS